MLQFSSYPRAAQSNQNVHVAAFATVVATKPLLSPQLRKMCYKTSIPTKYQLLEKVSVTTCGEWRQGCTTLSKSLGDVTEMYALNRLNLSK